MSGYKLSNRADRDIETITRFTVERWGRGQAEAYIAGLHEAFRLLAEFPEVGRRIDHVSPGYFRFDHASHSACYRITP